MEEQVMDKNKIYNYYMHLVHFISEKDESPGGKDKPIPGNFELIIVLVHYLRKDEPLIFDTPEIKVNE